MLISCLNWLTFDIFVLPHNVPAVSNKVANPQNNCVGHGVIHKGILSQNTLY